MMNDAIYIIAFIGAFLAIIITFFIITMLRIIAAMLNCKKTGW